MALPPADPARHRRQLRRRALVGWLGGAAALALLVLAVALGGGDEHDASGPVPAHSAGLFDYHMSSAQFDGLRTGETEDEVLEALGKVGLPEGETKVVFIRLFPPHDESIVCSYWEISDSAFEIGRLCFSRPGGILRQKLERDVSGVFGEESGVRA